VLQKKKEEKGFDVSRKTLLLFFFPTCGLSSEYVGGVRENEETLGRSPDTILSFESLCLWVRGQFRTQMA